MKRLVLFLMIFGMTATIAFSQKKETRQVSGFTGIDASSLFDITVAKGDKESLAIEADDNVMPYVRSEVKNGVLNLYLDNYKKENNNITILRAVIVMKNLDKVALSGACKLTSNDLFTPDKFKADCSGVTSMTAKVNTGQLSIATSGGSKIQINANVSGDTNIEMSGVSKMSGELKANNVALSSSGGCSIELTGLANNIKIDVSGTSNINIGDFTVKSAGIESSGASSVTVNATDVLKVNSSGVSSVNYKGSPSVQADNSQMAKVKKI